jgi:hypothetical protein
MRWEGMNLINLAADRGKWRAVCKYGNERSGFINCGKFVVKLGTV